ncbi:MAG: hypothetical protein M3139_02700 [Bacteroidota bacterium]|nr:hypothetical protein [Bacteroidota bacterium]
MNKNLVIAATMVAGVLAYFLFRKNSSDPEKDLRPIPTPKKHHVTKAFSNAKKHVMDVES